MIYWFLLILGCQACTKSLFTYVANIDSSYVGFLLYWGPMYVGSYICIKSLGMYVEYTDS